VHRDDSQKHSLRVEPRFSESCRRLAVRRGRSDPGTAPRFWVVVSRPRSHPRAGFLCRAAQRGPTGFAFYAVGHPSTTNVFVVFTSGKVWAQGPATDHTLLVSLARFSRCSQHKQSPFRREAANSPRQSLVLFAQSTADDQAVAIKRSRTLSTSPRPRSCCRLFQGFRAPP